jgi:hypothetical protein
MTGCQQEYRKIGDSIPSAINAGTVQTPFGCLDIQMLMSELPSADPANHDATRPSYVSTTVEA